MKKIICTLLSVSMLLTALPAFSEGGQQVQASMTDALTQVKQKVSVPDTLTGFDSRTSKDENGSIIYDFSWYNEDSSSTLEVECDEKGRISRYYAWQDYDETPDSTRLTKYKKSDALKLAEDFLKQIMPEAFTDSDVLSYTDASSRGTLRETGTHYSFSFLRKHSGIEVSSNRVYVNVIADNNGMSVRSVSADYNYGAEFEQSDTLIENADAAYKAVFPAKLYYQKDYEKSESGKPDVTNAVYKLEEYGEGYISAATGEKVTKWSEYNTFNTLEAAADSKAASGGGSSRLTPQELAEISNVAELKTENDIIAILKTLPDLKMSDKMTVSSSSVHKSGDDYMISLYLTENNERDMYVYANAKTGEIKSINSYGYSKYDRDFSASEKQKTAARHKAVVFFKAVSPSIAEQFEVDEVTSHAQTVSVSFIRKANDVPYLANSASISYDVLEECITAYSANYSEASFADITSAITADAAYDSLLEKFPLKEIYIPVSETEYKLCYTTSKPYTDIDAFTAEPLQNETTENGSYTDISGHWAENAVSRLAEVGIYLPGKQFRPDEAITKADLLTLFSAGLKDEGYIRYGLDEVTASMKRWGVIKKDDTVDDTPVTREDACVYMIRLAGYEKIARLSGIFSPQAPDATEISPENSGYMAILCGFGVIGNNGDLRPKDKLTRAEASAMLYTFLLNN